MQRLYGRGDRYASRTDLQHRLDQQGQRARSGHPNLAEAPSVTAEKFYHDIVCYARRLFGFGD